MEGIKNSMEKYIKISMIIFILLFTIVFKLSAQEIIFSWQHDSPEQVENYNFYVKKYPDGEFVRVWTGEMLTFTFEATEGIKYGFCITASNNYAESLKSLELIYKAEGDIGEPIIIPARPKLIIMKF